MSVDGFQIIVEYECGRTLPGWLPRRLGMLCSLILVYIVLCVGSKVEV